MEEKTSKKLVCLCPVDLIDQVDEYARSLHVNRTSAVNVLLSRALQYERMFQAMPRILEAVERLDADQVNGEGNPRPDRDGQYNMWNL